MVDVQLFLGDALEVAASMPANSANLILTDPPYYRVKGEWWDRQWDTPEGFIAWIGQLCQEWQRVLVPNGSLYVFASPKMAARVECEVGRWFNVLNHVVWRKPSSRHNQADATTLRGYFPQTERIIFAEHFGADNIAKGEAGYTAKCDELRGFVFEPLRAYLASERDRAGLTTRQVAEAFQRKTGSRTVTGMASHWFSTSQWNLPTAENYQWLRETFHSLNHGGEYLRREYEYLRREYEYLRREYEDLRREYEDLRREYEDLRRPFSVSAEVSYTDVWDFATVQAYPGKHPCEKPSPMLEHIIRASSRPGDVVADFFMGSGSTGEAARNLGRSFIGVEIAPHWHTIAQARISAAQQQLAMTL